jgi:hypothetical protein
MTQSVGMKAFTPMREGDSPRWPDLDPPATPGQSVVNGSSDSGFGRGTTSKFAGKYIERPDMLTGLSGQPEQPRYP